VPVRYQFMSLLDFVSLPQCPIAQTRTRACERNASRADVGVEQAENRVSESGVVSGEWAWQNTVEQREHGAEGRGAMSGGYRHEQGADILPLLLCSHAVARTWPLNHGYSYARFYQQRLFSDYAVIQRLRVRRVLSTLNLSLFSE